MENDKLMKSIDKEISEIDNEIKKLTAKKQSLIKRKEDMNLEIQHQKGVELSKQDWNRTNFKWSDKLTSVLENNFKISKLRPFQLPTMNAVLSKHDCILIMPTGGGKSLCFQAPALVSEGVTVVVSPLVSLMEDQCMALKRLNIDVAMINASLNRTEVTAIYKKMLDKSSTMKLLYVTPEKLAKSKQIMTKLQKMYEMGRFQIMAIDEVHCCSHWGHDFRPDYNFLGIMKRQFPKVTILGLTATATTDILTDVQKILMIESSLIFKAEFNRPNLKYEVRSKSGTLKESVGEIVQLIKSRFNNMSGIIYCCSVKETIDVTKVLQAQGLRAACYHGQLDAKDRSSIHYRWTVEDIRIIVATIAFGMGIDKPNVRFVIHHTISKSLENYYQESGRAGRDDNYAECILYFRFSDMSRQSALVFTERTGLEKLYSMVSYCIQVERCRKSIIAEYFGIKVEADNCGGMCDRCCAAGSDLQEVVITNYYNVLSSILEKAKSAGEKLTGNMLIDLWNGKSKAKLKISCKPPCLSRQQCELVIAYFVSQHYFEEDFHFTPYTSISYITKGSRTIKEPITLTFLKSTSPSQSSSSTIPSQKTSKKGSAKSSTKSTTPTENTSKKGSAKSSTKPSSYNTGPRKQKNKKSISQVKRKGDDSSLPTDIKKIKLNVVEIQID